MRLTTVFLIAFLLQLSAATLAQKVSMNLKNASLKTAIREIKSQTGYDFVYQESVFESARPVTIKTNKQDVLSVLKEIFENQPLTYELRSNTVIVKAAEKSFLDKVKDVTLDLFQGQTVDVRGRVLDENNMPLSGATINVKGTNQGTKTDAQGNFYLANVDEKAVLVVSFVGYKKQEIAVKEDVGVLVLGMEDNSLEQVQVIAYGEVKRKFLTSNIGSISGEQIAKQPVTNPLLALQGRVPGLLIQQTSGNTAGAVTTLIQGRNSINNGTEPFFVIDGIPYSPSIVGSSLAGQHIPGRVVLLISSIRLILKALKCSKMQMLPLYMDRVRLMALYLLQLKRERQGKPK